MNKNTNSRHWFLTWETNKLQKKLPSNLTVIEFFNYNCDEAILLKKLPSNLTVIEFFNYNCDEAILQLEKGEKAQKNYWQSFLS